MRILLDECLPNRLKHELPEHAVWTVQERKWSGIKNGKLLLLAEVDFDVFITVDQNMSYQQDLAKFRIAVVALSAPTNRLQSLKPLIPELLKTLSIIAAGEFVRIK